MACRARALAAVGGVAVALREPGAAAGWRTAGVVRRSGKRAAAALGIAPLLRGTGARANLGEAGPLDAAPACAIGGYGALRIGVALTDHAAGLGAGAAAPRDGHRECLPAASGEVDAHLADADRRARAIEQHHPHHARPVLQP